MIIFQQKVKLTFPKNVAMTVLLAKIILNDHITPRIFFYRANFFGYVDHCVKMKFTREREAHLLDEIQVEVCLVRLDALAEAHDRPHHAGRAVVHGVLRPVKIRRRRRL